MTAQLAVAERLEEAQRRVALVAQPQRGTLEITGPDRVAWLNGLVTCDVSQVGAERGTWGFLLSRTAKILSVVWVVAQADALLLSVSPGTAAVVLEELDRRLIMEDAEVRDVSSEWSWSLLVGPQGLASAAELAPSQASRLTFARVEMLGLGEVVVGHAPGELSGAPAPLDAASWTVLRLQRHWGEFGLDYGPEQRPHEAALERRGVAWDKGCYLGQEVVCMQEMRGKVKQALRVFTVAAPHGAALGPGAAVLSNGARIGEVTSGAFEPGAQQWWLMARASLASLDGPLEVEASAARHPAQLSAEPLSLVT